MAAFRKNRRAPLSAPTVGFDQQAEQPFLALPLGTLLNGRYVTGKVLGVGGFHFSWLDLLILLP